ncbi:hypothetical protein Dcar01_00259 [Deinococcus carri]|uniref:SAF domain-containing protein n=1 Tax=Deinococcus carri TaxID=1211323 RepID=A0ABP9W4T0_9DEIO
MRRALAILAALALSTAPLSAHATTAPTLTLTQQAQKADVIVRAKIGTPSNVKEGEVTWLVYPLTVTETVAGDAASLPQQAGQPVLYVLPGLEGLPDLRAGQEAFLLLYSKRLDSPIVGFNQGLYPIENGKVVRPGGAATTTAAADITTTSAAPTGISPGTATTPPTPGTATATATTPASPVVTSPPLTAPASGPAAPAGTTSPATTPASPGVTTPPLLPSTSTSPTPATPGATGTPTSASTPSNSSPASTPGTGSAANPAASPATAPATDDPLSDPAKFRDALRAARGAK